LTWLLNIWIFRWKRSPILWSTKWLGMTNLLGTIYHWNEPTSLQKTLPCILTNLNFSTKNFRFIINLLNLWSSLQATVPTCLSLRSCSHF
jgi:hypothetical protein